MGFFDSLGKIFSSVPVVGDIIGGVTGLVSTNMTNNANKNIAKDANKLQYQMFQEGNAFNAEQAQKQMNFQDAMYEKSLKNQWDMIKYNDPTNVKARMLEAGLNPSLVMSGTGSTAASGTAPSPASGAAGSAAGAPSAHAPTMENPFNNVMQGLGKRIELALMNSNKNKIDQEQFNLSEQGKFIATTAMKNIEEMNARIAKLAKDGKLTDEQRTQFELNNKILRNYGMQQAEANLANSIAQKRKLENEIEGVMLDNLTKNTALQYLPMQLKTSIANTVAQTALLNQKAMTEKEQRRYIQQSVSNLKQEWRKLVIDNRLSYETFKAQKDSVVQELRNLRANFIKTLSDSNLKGSVTGSFVGMPVTMGADIPIGFQAYAIDELIRRIDDISFDSK